MLALAVAFFKMCPSQTLTRKLCQTAWTLHVQLCDNRFEYAAKSVELTYVNTEEEDGKWRFRGEMAEKKLRSKQNEL